MPGKRGGARTTAHKRAFTAGGKRAQLLQRNKMANMARGAENVAQGRHTGASIDVTPAAWAAVTQHIGDCQFIEDGLDPILMRALHERVIYAGSVTCHREAPFEDIAIAAIAAAVRSDPSSNGRGPKKGEVVEITERQRVVIALIAEGYTNVEIGIKLGITPRTVKMHSDVLRRKLGASSRRAIPATYRHITGEDPFGISAHKDFRVVPTASPVETEEDAAWRELGKKRMAERAVAETAIVEAAAKDGYREGRALGDVVAELFEEAI